MQRCLVLLVACLLCVQCVTIRQSQRRASQNAPRDNFVEFKLGQMNPEELDNGTSIGLAAGMALDDRLHLTVDLDYFSTSFRNLRTVAVVDSLSPFQYTYESVELDFQSRQLSPYLLVTYQSPSYLSRGAFHLRGAMGGGFEFIFNKERNFIESVERNRFFWGYGLLFSGGLGLRISRSGMLFADLVYKSSTVRKEGDRDEHGLPTFTEIDLTGFGIRGGIHFRF